MPTWLVWGPSYLIHVLPLIGVLAIGLGYVHYRSKVDLEDTLVAKVVEKLSCFDLSAGVATPRVDVEEGGEASHDLKREPPGFGWC